MRKFATAWLVVMAAGWGPACREETGLVDLRDPQGALGNQRQNIAFGRLVPGRLFDIFLVSETGDDLVNLTNHPASDVNPVWSPDGLSLAFESNRDGATNIYTMTAAGENVRNISAIERRATEPDWSPDGRSITFQGETVSSIDIYVVNLADLSRRNLTNSDGLNYYPRYSPDGTRIAFLSDRTGRLALHVMNADGSDQKWITEISGVDASFTLKWSPDSRIILYSFSFGGLRDLFRINADGSGRINLTNHPSDDVLGDWSPDGKEIIFQSNRIGVFWIYRMNADGGNLVRITSGNDESDASYSPTGGRVLFLSSRRGAFELWIVDLAGLVEGLVTPTFASDRTPRWRPTRR
jgi:Tol biopolymer transport system component